MTDILCDTDDINTHLPTDKLDAGSTDALTTNSIRRFQIDVDRLIKGYLSGVFPPLTLAGWDSPDDTPDYIRAISGRLIAAYYYAQRYSEDDTEENKYAKAKYAEAMSMLECVRVGDVTLNLDTPEAGTKFSEAFFTPNSKSIPPKFSMESNFG